MIKFKPFSLLFTVLCAWVLLSCASPLAGLKPFVNPTAGYQFLYPNGWIQVQLKKTKDAPDVVLRDLVNETENISVVISPMEEESTSLQALGTPSEVGYLLQQKAIAPPNSGITAELVDAQSRQDGTTLYYQLEYLVNLPGQQRHDLASVVVNRGKLYTFSASTTEDRWDRVSSQFKTIVQSFSVDT